MTLYFAYGSNLYPEQMKCRCGNIVCRSRAKIKDYRLHFPKRSKQWGGFVASITPSKSNEVWGVVYELSKEQLTKLDKREGYYGQCRSTNIYERREIEVIVDCQNEEKLTVHTYIAEHIAEPNQLNQNNKPNERYISKIISGAEFWGLPKKYIKKLKKIRVNNST